MKKVKVILTTAVFALAITGAVVAKTNEKKRFASTTSYFRNAANNAWITITLSTAGFDPKLSTSTQAALIDKNNAQALIYIDQDLSDPAEFTKP